MFGRNRGGHPFSDLLRNHGNGNDKSPVKHSTSGTRNVGKHKGAMVHSGPEKGGVSTSVGSARSVPSATPFESNFGKKVAHGTGQRVGSQNRKAPAHNPINRLGAFGHPPGHKTMGHDGTQMERPGGMPSKTPANMDGKATPVRGGVKSKPRKNIGDAHHNVGRVRVAAHPRTVRDLASKL